MKKVRICFAFCFILMLLCGACGTAQTGSEPTREPKATEAPATAEIPETPTVTEVPVAAKTPEATEVPVATETSKATKAPVATEAPAATVTPKPTKAPVPTTTPKPMKAPNRDGELTFTFDEMEYRGGFNASFDVQGDGSVKAKFDAEWGQGFYALPQEVDLTRCEYITIKLKSERYTICTKLLDKGVFTDIWSSDIYNKYDCRGDGVVDYELSPEMSGTVWGVGIMAMENPTDFSDYTAEAYSITFHMKQEKGTEGATFTKEQTVWGDVTYDFNDVKLAHSYGASCKVNRDGSVDISYEGEWKEARFALPESMDMNYCKGITIKADTTFPMAVKLFDKKFKTIPGCNEVYVKWDCEEEGIYSYNIFPDVLTEFYGIGFVSKEEKNANENYKITVYSITFHMAAKEERTIPKDIAPDVTADMSLKNTYGTVFERFGVAVNMAELRHPLVFSEITEQYTGITLGNELKPELVYGGYGRRDILTVEEAKKQGYIIPKNYKEKTVPKFYFEDVDEALRICAENDLELRAHTLIWAAQTPAWFFRKGYSEDGAIVSPEVMDARIEFHIRNVMSYVYNHEYGHLVYAWDVVNEYYTTMTYDYEDAENGWEDVYGTFEKQGLTPAYVKLAFQVADDVLKEFGIRNEVSLVLNEVNAYSFPDIMISLVDYINSDGKVCDGVGMQAHLDVGWPEDPHTFGNAVKRYLAEGFEVQITELDMTNKNPFPGSEEKQRKHFRTIFTDLLEIKRNGGNLSSITIWGIGDDTSWRYPHMPLLYSDYETPKDVYYEVLQAYLDAGFKVE